MCSLIGGALGGEPSRSVNLGGVPGKALVRVEREGKAGTVGPGGLADGCSALLDVGECQLDRSVAAKDADFDLELLLVGVHFLDRA